MATSKTDPFYSRLLDLFQNGVGVARKTKGNLDYRPTMNNYSYRTTSKQSPVFGGTAKKHTRNTFNNTMNPSAIHRFTRYQEYEAMEEMAEINTALTVMAAETCAVDDKGKCFHIHTDNERINEILSNLFYDIVNIEFNLYWWVRSLPVKHDTMIPLLNGETVTIKELAERFDRGEESWVYSIQNETKEFVPGKVVWCGKNYTSNKIVKVWLDDNTFIETAPEHPFILRDGTEKRADQLSVNDSLMPFYTKISDKKLGDFASGYEQIYNPKSKNYKFVHRLVAKNVFSFSDEPKNEKMVTHHKNFNKLDNSPNNLQRMTQKEHYTFHGNHAIEFLTNPLTIEKRIAAIKIWHKSENAKKMHIETSKRQKGIYPKQFEVYNNSELHFKQNSLRGNSLRKIQEEIRKGIREPTPAMVGLRFDQTCIDFIIKHTNKAKNNFISQNKIRVVLLNDIEFISYFKKINPHWNGASKTALNTNLFNDLVKSVTSLSYLELLLATYPELKNNKQFNKSINTGIRTKILKNHKVLKIEINNELTDVYCMTVVGPNDERDRHNFAVCSKKEDGSLTRNGCFVANCKTGDFILYNRVDPKLGVTGVSPIPINEIERDEDFDPQNPELVKFVWQNQTLQAYQITHMRLIGNEAFLPFGTSMIEGARRAWRQLLLAEDSMLVYRVVRSPERRIFYIDVANIPGAEVGAYMEQMKNALKGSQVVDPTSGRADYRYSAYSQEEDFYIPVRGSDSATKIDTLKGGENTTATDDVEYLQRKLFSALHVPKAFLGYDESLSCLRFNTKISLLSGEEVTIEKLSKSDKQHWVYSCTPKGDIIPSRIVKVWPTKQVTQLYRVTLDDNEVVECTENHPFLLRDGSYKRADELTVGLSLMPGYRKTSSFKENDKLNGYEKIYNPRTGQWIYTHRLVKKYCQIDRHPSADKEKITVIHHASYDKKNNDPTALLIMGKNAHASHHNEMAQNLLTENSRNKLREAMKGDEYKHAQLEGVVTTWQENNNLSKRKIKLVETNRKFNKINKMQERLAEIRKLGYSTRVKKEITDYTQLKMSDLANIASNSKLEIEFFNKASITKKKFRKWLNEKNISYTGWMRENLNKYNHKIVSIEIVELVEPEWVYDLEVEQTQLIEGVNTPCTTLENSNFLLSSGIFVHNSKSTLALQDVRFSRTVAMIQKVVLAELNKLAIIHLFAHGFSGEDLVNFDLQLSNPSTIAQQQKLELLRSRLEILKNNYDPDQKLLSREFFLRNIMNLSESEIENERARIEEDKKFDARIEAVETALGRSSPYSDNFDGGTYGYGKTEEKTGESTAQLSSPPPSNTNTPEQPQGFVVAKPDNSDDSGEVIRKPNGDRPVKPQDQVAYNRSRRRTHGAEALATPDFKAMFSRNNVSLKDIYDKNFLGRRDPFGEGFDPTEDVFFEELPLAKSVTSPTITKEIHQILKTMDEQLSISRQWSSAGNGLLAENKEDE